MVQLPRRNINDATNRDVEKKIKAYLLNFDEPLRKFPYDINYFNPEQIRQQLSFSSYALKRVLRLKKIFKPNEAILFTRRLWDKPRADACLGSDLVAKRCSMNDELWRRYTSLKKQGKTLELDTVRRWIEQDQIKSKLYPKEADYKEQYLKQSLALKPNTKEFRIWLNHNRVSDLDQPPKWFTDKLQQEGKLQPILAELKSVM